MPKRYQHTEADLLYQRRRDAQIPDATRHAVNFRNRAIALLASAELTPEESARVSAIETLAFSNEMQRLAFKRSTRPDGARVRLLYPNPEGLATFKSEVELLGKFAEWVAGRPNRVKVAAGFDDYAAPSDPIETMRLAIERLTQDLLVSADALAIGTAFQTAGVLPAASEVH